MHRVSHRENAGGGQLLAVAFVSEAVLGHTSDPIAGADTDRSDKETGDARALALFESLLQ
jgi:hypothetical protein